MMTLAQLNALPAAQFVAALAGIFEHSPWVPEGVAGRRPFPSVAALHAAMCAAVEAAAAPRQLELIRAHPELAGRAAIRGELTEASAREQRGAGLDACTREQYEQLQALNGAYRERFAFPFVIAVKGHTPESIIAALGRRVGNDAAEERRVAISEICRIAQFRLAALLTEP